MSANKVTKITMIVDASQGKGEMASMNAELAGTQKAFSSAGAGASASLQQLLLAKNRLATETSAVAAQIKSENAALQELRALSAGGAQAQRQFGAAIADSEQKLLALLVTQRELSVSTAETNAALKVTTATTVQSATANQTAAAAAAENAAAQAALSAESEISAGKLIKVGVAIDKLGGVAIPGGKAIGTLAGAFSAMSIASLAAIAGIALLIGWIVSRIRAERELIQLNEEALKLDLARSNTAQGQQALTKDLTAILLQYSAGVKALNADQVKETESYYSLAAAQKIEDQMKAQGIERTLQARLTGQLLGTAMADLQQNYEKLTKKRQDDEVALNKTIEALIRFARESNQSTNQILAAARAYGVAGDALTQLTRELGGAELAQRRLNAAIEEQKAPQLDFKKTREGTLPLQESVASGMAEAAAAGIQRYDDRVRANAKSLGELHTAVKNHTIAMSDLNAETQQDVKRHEQLTETYHKAAGGAKAYASELVNLRKRAEEAEAALYGDSFSAREAKITAQIAAERSHLEINKRDKTAALQQLARIENAERSKIDQDRVEAEQAVMVEIARMNIENGNNEVAKQRQLLALDLSLREQALKKQFGDTAQTTDLIALYRQAKEAEYVKWYLSLWEKTDASRVAAEKQMLDAIDEERLKRDKLTLERAVKLARDIAAARGAVGGQLGGSVLNVPTAGQVNQVLKLIEQLGPAFKEVSRDANLVNRAFSEVDRLFGFVGRDARTLSLQLRALEQFGKGDAFGGLKTSLRAFGSEMINGGKLAVGFAQVLGDSFSSALGSSQGFLASMGASLISGMTAIIGQTLMQLGIRLVAHGVADVLIGNAINADPFTFGAGFPLIAAGHAEIAQGILMGAAGGLVSGAGQWAANKITGGENNKADAQSSAAGSTAGSSASATRQAANDPRYRTTVINVPGAPRVADSYEAWLERAFGQKQELASQRSNREVIAQRETMQRESGPITIVVQLGEGGVEHFLTTLMDGQGRLTLEGAIGKDKRRLRAALVG